MRIRAEAANHGLMVDCLRPAVRRRDADRFILRIAQIELLCQLVYNLVVQLRSVALLEHGKRRLLASDFGRKLPLREPRLSASRLHASAEFYAQVFHNADIMDFILSTRKWEDINIINNNINNVHKFVDIVDNINKCA